MTASPLVRAATAEDMPAVIALISRVYAEYGFVWDPAVEVPDLLAFERHYAPPHGAFLVMAADDAIVGSVGIERLPAATAEIHRLYLDAELRGQGRGRALMEAAMDWCREQAIARVVLWSDTRFDQAHRLYDRLGFARTGERVLPDDVNRTREYGFERVV